MYLQFQLVYAPRKDYAKINRDKENGMIPVLIQDVYVLNAFKIDGHFYNVKYFKSGWSIVYIDGIIGYHLKKNFSLKYI